MQIKISGTTSQAHFIVHAKQVHESAISAIKERVTGNLREITTYSSATQKKDNIVCFQAEKTRKKTL